MTPMFPTLLFIFCAVHIVLTLLTFVSFIHLFINGFRIEKILDRAAESALRAAEALSSSQTTDMEQDELPDVPNRAFKVMADRSGYVSRYQLDKLVSRVQELDLCVRYTHQIGEFVNEGAILCHVWDAKTRARRIEDSMETRIMDHEAFGKSKYNVNSPEDEEEKPWMAQVEERLGRFVSQGLVISKKRDGALDVTLGIQQLSDIAVRALSPGINDPQTAIQCMDVLSACLVTMAKMDLGVPNARDSDGHVRLCAPRRSFSFLLSMLDSIRRYGATDLQVVRRGLRLFGDLGAILTRAKHSDRVPGVFAQLKQWMLVAKKNFEGPELESVEEFYDHLLKSIDDADQLIIEKKEDANQDMQELEITHKDEDSERRVRSVKEPNTVMELLQRVIPSSTNAEEADDEE